MDKLKQESRLAVLDQIKALGDGAKQSIELSMLAQADDDDVSAAIYASMAANYQIAMTLARTITECWDD